MFANSYLEAQEALLFVTIDVEGKKFRQWRPRRHF